MPDMSKLQRGWCIVFPAGSSFIKLQLRKVVAHGREKASDLFLSRRLVPEDGC